VQGITAHEISLGKSHMPRTLQEATVI